MRLCCDSCTEGSRQLILCLVRTVTTGAGGEHQSSGASCGLVLLPSIFVGLVVAGFMMYIVWDQNAQGEIHDDNGIDWGYWLLIGFLWFIFGAVVSAILGAATVTIIRRVRSNRTI